MLKLLRCAVLSARLIRFNRGAKAPQYTGEGKIRSLTRLSGHMRKANRQRRASASYGLWTAEATSRARPVKIAPAVLANLQIGIGQIGIGEISIKQVCAFQIGIG